MYDPSARRARAYRYSSTPALLPYALWLRAGLIGLFAAAGGLAMLVDGTGAVGTSLAWLAGGAALVAYSWRRFVAATAALDAATGDDAAASARRPGAPAVRRILTPG
jgi:hypothetical protein